MKRFVLLVVVASVMVAVTLAMVGPAMAAPPFVECAPGFRPEPTLVSLDPPKIVWECVPVGQPS